MARISLLSLAAVLAALLTAPAAPAATVTHSFDTDAQGWTAWAYNAGSTTAATWLSGEIQVTGQPGTTSFFRAPSTLLSGDERGAINGTLAFDLKAAPDSHMEQGDADVLIDTGNGYIDYAVTPFTTESGLTHYEVPLRVDGAGACTGPPTIRYCWKAADGHMLTASEFVAAMDSVQSLSIRASNKYASGETTGVLDNVVLTTPDAPATDTGGETGGTTGGTTTSGGGTTTTTTTTATGLTAAQAQPIVTAAAAEALADLVSALMKSQSWTEKQIVTALGPFDADLLIAARAIYGASGNKASASKAQVLASAKLSLAKGTTGKLALKLNKKGKALLRKKGKLKVSVVLAATNQATGATKTVTKVVTVKSKKRKRK